MRAKVNRQWRLCGSPTGSIQKSDFEWESNRSILKQGEVLVRNILLSLDPTNRVWMQETDSYLPAVGLGSDARRTIGVVEESRNVNFQEGNSVQGLLGCKTTQCTTHGSDPVAQQTRRSL